MNMKRLLESLPLWDSKWRYSIQSIYYDITGKVTKYSRLRREFRKRVGYELNLESPKSFNEKICWKKIYDRNPLLPIVADKYKVREYVQSILGDEADDILIPLLYVTDDPETIPFDGLPEEYIIKANHGSRTNIIVQKDQDVNKRDIITQCKKWLNLTYGLSAYEWAYQNIDKKIIIEELLRDSKGEIPVDYKFHIIHNKCELIQVDYNRHENHTMTFYSPEWVPLDIEKGRNGRGPISPRPNSLKKMISISERLSTSFDYIRIDLYAIDNRIYFGEMTNYPASGFGPWRPQRFDFELGEKWRIIPNYWKM